MARYDWIVIFIIPVFFAFLGFGIFVSAIMKGPRWQKSKSPSDLSRVSTYLGFTIMSIASIDFGFGVLFYLQSFMTPPAASASVAILVVVTGIPVGLVGAIIYAFGDWKQGGVINTKPKSFRNRRARRGTLSTLHEPRETIGVEAAASRSIGKTNGRRIDSPNGVGIARKQRRIQASIKETKEDGKS